MYYGLFCGFNAVTSIIWAIFYFVNTNVTAATDNWVLYARVYAVVGALIIYPISAYISYLFYKQLVVSVEEYMQQGGGLDPYGDSAEANGGAFGGQGQEMAPDFENAPPSAGRPGQSHFTAFSGQGHTLGAT